MSFDMNQCKPGDDLRSVHGKVFTYVEKDESREDYPHIVEYPGGGRGSRCDDGFVYRTARLDIDENIVGFYTVEK